LALGGGRRGGLPQVPAGTDAGVGATSVSWETSLRQAKTGPNQRKPS